MHKLRILLLLIIHKTDDMKAINEILLVLHFPVILISSSPLILHILSNTCYIASPPPMKLITDYIVSLFHCFIFILFDRFSVVGLIFYYLSIYIRLLLELGT